MSNRHADEVFVAIHGRQKHFLGALEAPFEGCDDQFYTWFVSTTMLCSMTQEPRKFDNYLLVRKALQPTKVRLGGICLAFFQVGSHLKQPGTYELADADLII